MRSNVKEIPDIDAQSPSYDIMLDNYYNNKENQSQADITTASLPELPPSAQIDLEDPDETNKPTPPIEDKLDLITQPIANPVYDIKIVNLKHKPITDNSENLRIEKEYVKQHETNENKIEFRTVTVKASNTAVCMDGTLPGYYLREGFGIGKHKWIIHLHGGAWCYDLSSCLKRRGTILGSTGHSAKENITTFFHGILSKNSKINPNFYNWNIAVLSYCDGGLFSGNRKKSVSGKGREFHFRGRSILKSLIHDLRHKFLHEATDVVLSGTSAGGLALVLQGDFIRKQIPSNVKVRGLIDAGLFLDQSALRGKSIARHQFKALYSLHRPILNKACLESFSKKERYLCLFPQYTIKFVKLPLYIVNSLYDHWQLSYLQGVYCVYDDKKCGTQEHDRILNFRYTMYGVLSKVKQFKNDTGVFANSCLGHGQVILDYTWSKVKINNQNIAQSFHDWFNDGKLSHFNADCKYPCNGSCPKLLAQRCVNNFKGASENRRKRDAELC